jgi:hypothetical protein
MHAAKIRAIRAKIRVVFVSTTESIRIRRESMDLKLVPLRIPTGWAVTWNTFYEVTPILEGNELVNAADFDEDLLQIESITFEEEMGRIEVEPYILDLGWYPAEDPNGAYTLTLLRGDWDHVLKTFTSRNIAEIQTTIDRWLEILSGSWGDADAYRRL